MQRSWVPILPLVFAMGVACSSPASDDDDLAAGIASTPAGGELRLAPGRVYVITRTVQLDRPIRLAGQGATIRAADGARINDAVLRSREVDGVQIRHLSIDANADRGGADYGIWITGGSGHIVENVAVRNTTQSCIAIEDAVSTIMGNQLLRCGRALNMVGGGATNNHGIMIFALTGRIAGVNISDNVVIGAHRKCITSYVRNNGSIQSLSFTNNRLSDCGLGGIYVAGAKGAMPQRNISSARNLVSRSYVGMEFDAVIGLTSRDDQVIGNLGSATQGVEGIVLQGVQDALFERTFVSDTGGGGIAVRNSYLVRLQAPRVVRPNSADRPFGPGIHFHGTRNSRAENAEIIDDRTVPRMTHGFVEDGAAAQNFFSANHIVGAAAKPVLRSR